MLKKSMDTCKKRYLLFFTCLFFFQGFYGQNFIETSIDARGVNKSSSTGYPMNIDKDGFLWYANTHEIIRDTGTEKFIHKYKVKEGFLELDPSRIFISSTGLVTVTSSKGAYIYDTRTGISTLFSPKSPDGLPYRFDQVIEDLNRNLWFPSELNKIFRYSPDHSMMSFTIPKMPFTRYDDPNILDYDNRIFIEGFLDDETLILNQSGNIYTFSSNKTIQIYKNPNAKHYYKKFITIKKGVFSIQKNKGSFTIENNTISFVFLPEIDRYLFEFPDKGFFITKETEDEGEHFFLRSITNQLLFFAAEPALQQKKLDLKHRQVFDKKITNVFTVTKSSIWVSTFDEKFHGLKINKSFFSQYLQQKFPVSCRSIIELKDNIIVNTHSGFFIKNMNSDTFKKLELHLDLTSSSEEEVLNKIQENTYGLLKENDSIIWAYGFYPSLLRINVNKRTGKEYHNASFPYQGFLHYTDAVKKNDENLLLAGKYGVHELIRKDNRFVFENHDKGFLAPLKAIFVNDLFLEKDIQTLWIGTKKGLYKADLRNKTLQKVYYNSANNSINNITTVYRDHRGTLWAGTYDGLFKVSNKEHFKNTQINEFIPSILDRGIVTGIEELEEHLFISTFNGLYQITPSSENALTSFYVSDGLTDNEFNFKSSFKSKNGKLYFGGINGLISFDADDLYTSHKDFQIFLVKDKLFNSKTGMLSSTHFSDNTAYNLYPNNNYLELSFSINNIWNRSNNNYEYRISKLSDTWIRLDNNHKVILAGLAPDEYELEVRGYANNGNNKTNTLIYKITVHQVFYKKIWFILLCFTSIAFLITYFLSTYYKKSNQRLVRRNRMLTLESKALLAQMNPHFIFNTLNSIQNIMVLKGEIEANKYFSKFSKLIRMTLEISKKDYVSLKAEFDYLKNYISLESLRLNDELNYQFDIDTQLNLKRLFIPALLIQPIVENAIIHGLAPKENDRNLLIKCFKKENFLFIIIEDNGIGRAAALTKKNGSKNNHISLATSILSERIAIHNVMKKNKVSCTVDDIISDQQVCGTRVTFTIII